MASPPSACAGIYVHVPFCVRKCPYCDFYSITDRSVIPAYVNAVIRGMAMCPKPAEPADTLYIGGGTPSVLDAAQIGRIIESARAAFSIGPGAEITMEINPGTVSPRQMAGFRAAGVNRVNIGIQSFHAPHLHFLGRIHTADQGVAAVAMARHAGIDNVGIDLIYGIPDQRKNLWQQDLEKALALSPEHISCYLLTLEPGTPMDADCRSGRFRAMPDARQSALFETTIAVLEGAGYRHYEISNFARFSHTRSRHNRKYWSGAPYVGLGPSAHSFVNGVRSWNVRSVSDYIRLIEAGNPAVADREEPDTSQQMIEAIFLGLRQCDGIDTGAFARRFTIDFDRRFGPAARALADGGYLDYHPPRCRLTRKGMVMLDSVAGRLIDQI